MPQYKLLIQRYPYGGTEASECVSWLMATFQKASRDPRFSEVKSSWVNDTPITMTRNQSFIAAKKAGFDFMLLVDSDMAPDVELRADPTAVPFYDAAVEYALKSPKPCVVAAPYCGPPPLENVYVFRWANRGNTLHPLAAGAKLDQFTREEAALLAGIQPVGALPTGLMLLDLRVLDKLPHPYTYYEYHEGGKDECPGCHQKARGPEREKASTEDVTFTRDLGMLGVPVLCAWSSWAGHIKRYVVGKPRMYTTDIVSHKMREAVARRVFPGEELREVELDSELARSLAARESQRYAETNRHGVAPVTEADVYAGMESEVAGMVEDLAAVANAVPVMPWTGKPSAELHPLDETAAFVASLAQVPPGTVLLMESNLPADHPLVVKPGVEPVELADHKLKFGSDLPQGWFSGLTHGEPRGAAAERNPAHPLNLDPGFASLVNQTFTPTPPARNNFVGPTETAVDGAAPPPAGMMYPWQLPPT